ncbi:MAG: hypothetical protein RBT50_00365 [Bacteroidales bacterium]|jgi:hypothetical protein|nr:hypothetical protein [Bacteroidales bacterium]
MIKRGFYWVALGLLSLLTANGSAQDQKDTLRVLFVGNSYTYFENLPQVVSVLSEQTGTILITEKITIGGAKLSEHWRGARSLNTIEKIRNGDYDIVVLQEWSLGTVNERDSAVYYLGLFSKLAREAGAEPYFYLTWAREKIPQQQKVISMVYRETAALNKATVVPAGEAWALARSLRPEIKLFDPDGTHPSDRGTYLTACVFVATITGELPETISGVPAVRDNRGEEIILMRIDQMDVEFFRRVTLETLEN